MESAMALVTKASGPLTVIKEDESNIFHKFRAVFSAPYCRKRLVYWVESKWGRTILRQVMDWNHRTKKSDKVITTFKGLPDLDIILMAIAGANTESIRTGIRWEVYHDYECADLWEMGRFDHIDLLGSCDPQKIRHLIQTGHINVLTTAEAWDFDALLHTHRCPVCHAGMSEEILVFDPRIMGCKACGYDVNKDTKYDTLRPLMEKLLRKLTRSGCKSHPAQNPLGHESYLLLDIHYTPIFAWIFDNILHTSGYSFYLRDTSGKGVYDPKLIQQCYRQSTYALMRIPDVRERIHACIRSFHENLHQRALSGNFLDPTDDPEVNRAWRKEQHRADLAALDAHMKSFAHLHDILLTPETKLSKAEHHERQDKVKKVLDAVSWLPEYMEYMVEYLYKEQTTGGHNV